MLMVVVDLLGSHEHVGILLQSSRAQEPYPDRPRRKGLWHGAQPIRRASM